MKNTIHVDMFLQALNAVHSSNNGGMLSIAEVRDWCSLDKAVFDAVALELAKNNVIALYEHDFPQGMLAEERELLVRSADGKRYYNGITVKGN
jgi:hypothetical protein